MSAVGDHMHGHAARRPLTRAQRAARRHSLMVRIMRWLFPGVGLLILAVMVGLVVLFNVLSGLGATNMMLTSEGLVMDHPELSGHDGDRSYRVTAYRAIQRLSDPRVIDLETIRADITLSKDQSAQIVALKGTYNNATESLRLYEGIQLEWSEGYTVDLSEVEIDLSNGALKTSQVVSIRSDQGRVVAGKLDYDKAKGIVRFSDGIKMTLNPASQGQ
ncbi:MULTISPECIES: LPS export ABC transporter periplasmic protein LptC [Stappiaceae]|mgnify:CR=1 FL=1|uniref:LPS export ABC transporter periplasmic protein LptC n=1 Tax=Stappiaceae TaxID=2821832 RepID=UPI0004B1EFA9|nr:MULTISPECIES: LPS export ABC transporter periplasmic protein LptC [Stappiaceae]MCR9280539.1 LPS export ABC transporter periplasmic protein LptC [Paracoccaceae bacterium]MEC9421275.1 LPS export ABC transporter periplasmic protein LptC [Pseudomonadota bacterium]MBO9457834.1 LPS export ABC transporter periplasmic protein LptC [Labrenzia sp. R5_0]MEC9469214.1 LPS export ABC transporter periplasmic protein LptC [Pseudomonadota bacterium]MEE2864362.1 LPS export ABC transporter periplasmic protein